MASPTFDTVQREWEARYQRKIDQRGEVNIYSTIQEALERVGTARSGPYTFEKRGDQFVVSIVTDCGTETWQVRRWDFLPRPNTFTDFVLTKLDAQGCQLPHASVVVEDLFTFELDSSGRSALRLAPNWTQVVDRCRGEVTQIQQSEARDAADMRSFDLPRERPLGTVQLLSQNTDDHALRPGGPADYRHFTELLARRGHTVVPLQRGLSIPVQQDPSQIVRDALYEFTGRGIRDVFLNLHTHGKDGFYFPRGADLPPYRLTHTDLMAVFREFPDVQVTINSVACYGGWKDTDGAALQDAPGAPEGRVTVITQTTPEAYNTSSGNYDTALNHYLALTNADGTPKHTFGQAHLLADRDTQSFMGFNPRVRRSSPGGFRETAGCDHPTWSRDRV